MDIFLVMLSLKNGSTDLADFFSVVFVIVWAMFMSNTISKIQLLKGGKDKSIIKSFFTVQPMIIVRGLI